MENIKDKDLYRYTMFLGIAIALFGLVRFIMSGDLSLFFFVGLGFVLFSIIASDEESGPKGELE